MIRRIFAALTLAAAALVGASPAAWAACPDYDLDTAQEIVQAGGTGTAIWFDIKSCDYGSYHDAYQIRFRYNDTYVTNLPDSCATTYAYGSTLAAKRCGTFGDDYWYAYPDTAYNTCWDPCEFFTSGYVNFHAYPNVYYSIAGTLS